MCKSSEESYCERTSSLGRQVTKAGFAWLFDGTTFWTWDAPVELQRKAQYISKRDPGGAMIWSLDGDTGNGELISALHRNLR